MEDQKIFWLYFSFCVWAKEFEISLLVQMAQNNEVMKQEPSAFLTELY